MSKPRRPEESKAKGTAPELGPFSYENWRAPKGLVTPHAYEYPLFSDVRITGQIVEGLGPYMVLNALRRDDRDLWLPVLVLRAEILALPDVKIDFTRTDVSRYHGGGLADELAALISLLLGVRLKAGHESRYFWAGEDPRGQPSGGAFGGTSPLLLQSRQCVIPQLREGAGLESAHLLARFPDLDPDCAMSVVRAARLYQDGVWVADSEPQLAWIFLVSALEVAANQWHHTDRSPAGVLEELWPEMAAILRQGGETVLTQAAKQLKGLVKSTQKFVDFALEFAPPALEPRPPKTGQCDWSRDGLAAAFRTIYKHRSNALHAGTPFPPLMCEPPPLYGKGDGPRPERHFATGAAAQGGIWREEDLPMLLHTFEYITRACLVKWWASMLDGKAE